MKGLLELFLTFAKVGVMTFGGGMAMLPILQREVVENKGWATDEELTDYFAIGQCTPGIIAVNTATFIGQKQKGVWGGIVATLGVVFPSLVIIMLLAAALSFVMGYAAVQHALNGVRVCVCVLVANAVLGLAKKSLVDKFAIALYVVVLVLALFTGISSAVLVVAAGAVGVLTLFIPALNQAKGNEQDPKEGK